MVKQGAYINDVHSLEILNTTIERSGEAMVSIDQDVCNYLSEVMNTLKSQLDFIRDRLNEAEMRLNAAEMALSACHCSQVIIPETGIVVPSCECEERDVAEARCEVEKWRTRYERGQQIVGECQHEIAEYNGAGGGHSLVLAMYGQQTPKATQLLRGCIDNLQGILNSDMAVGTSTDTDTIPEGMESHVSDGKSVNGLKDFFEM